MNEPQEEINLPPHLLASTKRFYHTRVKAGSMPISFSDGGWCNDYSRDAFDAYLARFSKSDRKEITKGAELLAQTQEKTTKLLARLLSDMQTDEVQLLIRELAK